jgi:hypothetical protein
VTSGLAACGYFHRAGKRSFVRRRLVLTLDREPQPRFDTEPGQSDQYREQKCDEYQDDTARVPRQPSWPYPKRIPSSNHDCPLSGGQIPLADGGVEIGGPGLESRRDMEQSTG